ncbi:MAG: L-lactate permease [Clostridia bacterium]|nr:L-lactate permease [Clostridia bacterium]
MGDTQIKEKKALSKNYVLFLVFTAAFALLGIIMSAMGVDANSSSGAFLNIITFILALMPILLVIIGMVGFKLSALKVAPFAFVLSVVFVFSYFANPENSASVITNLVFTNTWGGVKSGLYIVGLLLFSFIILDILQSTGAMEQIKRALSVISPDKRVQLIIIGLFVVIFLEGAAGAGTPAAIAAPFLIGLGFNPITAVVVALMSDGLCASWGGSGVTTVTGGAATVAAGFSSINLNAGMVGMIHMVGVFIMPWLIMLIAFGMDSFKDKGIKPFLLFSGFIGALIMFLLSNYTGPIIVDMGTGLLCIVLTMACVRLFKIQTSGKYMNEVKMTESGKQMSTLKALAPYILIMIILPGNIVTSKFITLADGRTLWAATVGALTYTGWIDALLCVCSIIGAAILRVKIGEYMKAAAASVKKLIPVFIIMASLLAVANIMKMKYDGTYAMITLAAADMAAVAGGLYPAAAVLIGAVGSFVTGTGLGSNIMFSEMHIGAAGTLGINQITVFAAQNAGGSLGNMICPNNITAACATVGETGNEGIVLKRAMTAFLIVLVLYMALALLYTYVLFPNVSLEYGNVISSLLK